MSDDLVCVTVSIDSRIVTAVQREEKASRKSRGGIVARVIGAYVHQRNDGYILYGQSCSQERRDRKSESGKGRHCEQLENKNTIGKEADCLKNRNKLKGTCHYLYFGRRCDIDVTSRTRNIY